MKTKFIIFSAILTLFKLTIYSQVNSTINSNSIPGIITINSDAKIDKLIKVKFLEKKHSNYKIQLYYGSLEKAHSVLSKFNLNFTEWSGKIEYETPNYKVWIGNFEKRLDADKALLKISKKFPHAFIFKPESD